MGIRVWPVIEGKDKHHCFGGLTEWKWLADCASSGVLWAVAHKMRFTPLHRLQGDARADAIDVMGLEEVEEYESVAERGEDGLLYYKGQLLWRTEREWFDSQVGLQTVRGLLIWLENHPQVPDDLDLSVANPLFTGAAEYDAVGFAYILQELEAILVQAETGGKRFYLACDA